MVTINTNNQISLWITIENYAFNITFSLKKKKKKKISLEETFVEIQVSWKTHFKIYILHTNKNDIYIWKK